MRSILEQRPEQPAIVHNGTTVSYAELADKIRTRAGQLGPSPGTVPVYVKHRPETVVDLLGIWAAGGTYLPIDPKFPAGRQQTMREAAEKTDAAYVLFTSGSTGAPKPVLTPRKAIATTVNALTDLFEITPDDRVLQFASLSWDTCFEEILPTLTAGATLVFDDETHTGSFPRFLRAVHQQAITVLDLPSAYWHELVLHLAGTRQKLPEQLRLVIIGGEPVNIKRLDDWRSLDTSRIRLLNTYGCTETTLITHAVDLHGPTTDECAKTSAPIGRRLPHVREKINEDGELLIGGPALALGYHRLPDATSERFVEIGGERFFRTGDRVSRKPDGCLLHEGRLDGELKIRGIRVNPAEVEATIAQHPSIRGVAVVGVPLAGHTVLAAYLLPQAGIDADGLDTDVRRFLNERAPAHLIPARISIVSALAYTASGKVDRAAVREANR